MRTSVFLTGISQSIVDRAIDLGFAKTKDEVLRMGLFSLNEKYELINISDREMQLVSNKIQRMDEDVRTGKAKYISSKEALGKYAKYLK
ncbi:MAG: hypothetical protein V1824_00135 [archaeon]